jgi:hypothetical protein
MSSVRAGYLNPDTGTERKRGQDPIARPPDRTKTWRGSDPARFPRRSAQFSASETITKGCSMSNDINTTPAGPGTGTSVSEVPTTPRGERRGGVRATSKTPAPTSVDRELQAAARLVSEPPESYGTSRAERRLRRYRPRLVAELVRQKSSGSYEPGAHGWTAL